MDSLFFSHDSFSKDMCRILRSSDSFLDKVEKLLIHQDHSMRWFPAVPLQIRLDIDLLPEILDLRLQLPEIQLSCVKQLEFLLQLASFGPEIVNLQKIHQIISTTKYVMT